MRVCPDPAPRGRSTTAPVVASRAMWMSPEDARSDFILAAAATLFGPLLVGLLLNLPFYPSGLLGGLLGLVWIFVATALVPILLVRYRDQGLEGYGLGGSREAWASGLAIAAPIVLVGWLRGWLGLQLGPAWALLGRVANDVGNPVIGASRSIVDILLAVAFVVVLLVSGIVLIGFLVSRARDGFRRNELPIVEGLRTYGMGAAAVGLLLGLLASIGRGVSAPVVLMNVVGLAAVILLADRLVTPGEMTSRATLLAPAIVVVVVQIMSFGGLFRGDLLLGLFHGAMSGALAIVLAALLETRRYAWAMLPVAVAATLYPTCLSLPTAFNAGLIGAGC